VQQASVLPGSSSLDLAKKPSRKADIAWEHELEDVGEFDDEPAFDDGDTPAQF
jgi:hypothetical protein